MLGMIFVLLCVFFVFVSSSNSSRLLFEVAKYMEIYNSIVSAIVTSYVDDVSPEKLIRKGIEATLSSLDPYTVFYSEEETEQYRFFTTGEYGGIGAIISKDTQTKYIYIVDIYEGYPAHKAGLHIGDIITHIDNHDTRDISVEQASRLLKGTPDTKVKVRINRPYIDSSFTIELKREEIKISPVMSPILIRDSIGYVKVISFTEGVSEKLKNAIKELINRGARYFILDLRDNGGGLLQEAVSVSNIFLPKNKLVVSTKGKIEEWFKQYYTVSEPINDTSPLAVLINENSASASEIVSGAIQDHDRGIIVGTNSFGKGLVQQTRDMPYKTSLKITVAKYYTPSGRCIQKIDYSRRDTNDNPVVFPDSLHKVFKTSNGRPVRSTEGISPDIYVKDSNLSEITSALLRKNLIFDFATYCQNTRPADTSIINDDTRLYNEFLQFIKKYNRKDDIILNISNHIQQIKKLVNENGDYASIKPHISEIEKQIEIIRDSLLYAYRDEILRVLKWHLLKRYFSSERALSFYITTDAVVDTAISALTNKKRYCDILNIKAPQ